MGGNVGYSIAFWDDRYPILYKTPKIEKSYRILKKSLKIFKFGFIGLTEESGMGLGDYSSVTPFGRATFPHKGRLSWYVSRSPKTENILIHICF